MIRRLAGPYAVVGWLTTLVGAVGAITLRIVDPVPVVPSTFGFSDTALLGFEFLGVTFASFGSLLVVRRPGNAVGVVFALFQPVRRRVQNAVDRRFDRARYDADRTVRAFSGRLRDETDLAAVSLEIMDTATAAVRPRSVTVWLRRRWR